MTPHLERPPDYAVFHGKVGDALLRPWFDDLALYLVTQWYLPLSRAWAAAAIAGESLERFADELEMPVPPRPWVRRALARVARRREAYERSTAAWEAAFFGDADVDPATLVAREKARRRAAHGYMSGRSQFLRLRRGVPAAKWEITGPDALAAIHGERRDGVAFPAPAACAVDVSRKVPAGPVTEYWLRYPSPCPRIGDTGWARVSEPPDSSGLPTMIFLHGITMETEMWRGAADPVAVFADEGVRLVQPDAPWHGRRAELGHYGGEPAFAYGPRGMIELFEGWVAEVGALVAWARRTGSTQVAVGGVSLGALTSQLVATAARDWPPEMRPDALFLVATTADLGAATFSGALASGIGVVPHMRRSGWNRRRLAQWRGLLEPVGEPAMPPEDVVMMLGSADKVTPYPGGRMLAERWRVPERNVYVSRRGHFTASLALYRERTALHRLLSLLRRT